MYQEWFKDFEEATKQENSMSEDEIIEIIKDIKRALRGDTINRYITGKQHFQALERFIRPIQ